MQWKIPTEIQLMLNHTTESDYFFMISINPYEIRHTITSRSLLPSHPIRIYPMSILLKLWEIDRLSTYMTTSSENPHQISIKIFSISFFTIFLFWASHPNEVSTLSPASIPIPIPMHLFWIRSDRQHPSIIRIFHFCHLIYWHKHPEQSAILFSGTFWQLSGIPFDSMALKFDLFSFHQFPSLNFCFWPFHCGETFRLNNWMRLTKEYLEKGVIEIWSSVESFDSMIANLAFPIQKNAMHGWNTSYPMPILNKTRYPWITLTS
jgi:hypothetical protein